MSNKKLSLYGLLIGGAALVSLLLIQTLSGSESLPPQEVASESAATTTELANLNRRIDNTQSAEYKQWHKNLQASHLNKADVLEFLGGNLSDAQKNALIDLQLKRMAETGSYDELKSWQQRLSQSVLSSVLDDRLGDKMGRLLGEASTPEQLEALESAYRAQGAAMPRGNKIAVIMASKNGAFVGQILDDEQEHLGVRESAIERLGELGDKDKLLQVASGQSNADPVLKITSLQNLGKTASTDREITDVLALSKAQPGKDELGRSAFDVAQVGISESNVDGKSTALLTEWEASLLAAQNGPISTQQLVDTLVTGKALAHAIWTEANAKTAMDIIDNRLAPLVQSQLTMAPKSEGNNAALQALAEFNKDFTSECTARRADACQSADDRRSQFKDELTSSVEPKLENTDLAFYNHKATP